MLAGADWRYPVICKPVRGDNARGLVLVADADELARLPWPEPVALVQEYVSGDGRDLELYGVGSAVWAVRRRSPLRPQLPDVAELVPATSALRSLARRAAAVFGLTFYGVDCLVTPDGPVVIEVNDFPNYTGVPDADQRLAAHVVAAAGSTQQAREVTTCASR